MSGIPIFLLSNRTFCDDGDVLSALSVLSLHGLAAFSQFIPKEEIYILNIFQSQFLAMGNTTFSLNNVKNSNDSHMNTFIIMLHRCGS